MKEYILNIETSTNVCSASITSGPDNLVSRESIEGPSHSSLLTVFVGEIMEEAALDYASLSAVSVSMGPGSYTGLRIGVSAAKGICYAAGLPLIAINTLDLMTEMALSSGYIENGGLLCPMIDARRLEVYTALFNAEGKQLTDVRAEIITEETFREFDSNEKLWLFGNGAGKCMNIINYPNIMFIPEIYPSASKMGRLSYRAFTEGKFESIAYFNPFYLKDFIATTPRNKIL